MKSEAIKKALIGILYTLHRIQVNLPRKGTKMIGKQEHFSLIFVQNEVE